MNTIFWSLVLLCGFLLLLCFWLYHQFSRLKTELNSLEEFKRSLEERLNVEEQQIQAQGERIPALVSQNSYLLSQKEELQKELKEERELKGVSESGRIKLQSEKELQKEHQGLLGEELKKLALEQTQSAKASWKEEQGALLKRHKEVMEALQKSLFDKGTELNKEVSEFKGAFSTEMKSLKEQVILVSSEAKALSSALRGGKVKQVGNWGEQQFKLLLESMGLREGTDFQTQESTKTEKEGILKQGYPDFVLSLPSGLKLIVDAKVNLKDYLDYQEADSEEERKVALKAFKETLKRTIAELSNRNYQDAILGASPDVFMYMPHEGAFLLLMEKLPELFEEAVSQRIIVIGRSAVFCLLRLMEQFKRAELSQMSLEEVKKDTQLLYDRVLNTLERFEKLDTHLRGAQGAFLELKDSLRDKGTSLEKTAERLLQKGFASNKTAASQKRYKKLIEGKNSPSMEPDLLDITKENLD